MSDLGGVTHLVMPPARWEQPTVVHPAVAYDVLALARLLIGATAVSVLIWALLQRMGDPSLTASALFLRTASSQVAGMATNGITSHLRRGLMPGAGWRPSQSGGGGGSTQAAFVVLVGPGTGPQTGLRLMLKSLHAHVLVAHPRPVLLFYGDDVPPEQYAPEAMDGICPPEVRHLVEVHRIAYALPDNMRLVALHDIVNLKGYPGYQLMCQWNFVQLVRHPRIRKLDYICRLDTDSRINGPVDVEFFDYMAENRLHYAYREIRGERYEWTDGLWNFAADWLHTHMSTAAQALAEENSFWEGYEMGHNDSFWMVWNEFEILHVPRYLQQDMLDFADAVDATHHIFDRRWGDSPLRYVQNKLFLNYTAETRQLDFLSYYHDKGNRWDFPPGPPPASLAGLPPTAQVPMS